MWGDQEMIEVPRHFPTNGSGKFSERVSYMQLAVVYAHRDLQRELFRLHTLGLALNVTQQDAASRYRLICLRF